MGRRTRFAYDANSLTGLIDQVDYVVQSLRKAVEEYEATEINRPILIDFQASVEKAVNDFMKLQLDVETQVRAMKIEQQVQEQRCTREAVDARLTESEKTNGSAAKRVASAAQSKKRKRAPSST